MRKVIRRLGITSIVLLIGISISNAQCNADSKADACVSKLQDGFIFVKKFAVDGQAGAKEKLEFPYLFSKNMQYYINICNEGADTDGIVVTMYDTKRQMVSTNYNNGKFYPAIIYPCNASGIYYITFTFKDSQNYCGGGVLGFKK